MRQPDFTVTEQENVRAVLWYLHDRSGSWKVAAAALGYSDVAVRKVIKGGLVTPAMVVRVAKLAGARIDDVLTGQFRPPATCSQCGQALVGA